METHFKGTKRCNHEKIYDILVFIKNFIPKRNTYKGDTKIVKTHIIYKCNLNGNEALFYFNYLQDNNFILDFKITEKGLMFIKLFEEFFMWGDFYGYGKQQKCSADNGGNVYNNKF